jgi:hypothetical protein
MTWLIGLVALGATAGCGNVVEDVAYTGLTGVAVDSRGNVSVRVVTCGDAVEQISIVKDREGLDDDQSNEPVATLKATSAAQAEADVSLADPGRQWQPSTPVQLQPDIGYIFSANTSDGDTDQVWLSAAQRSTLKPGSVYVQDHDAGDDALASLTDAEFTKLATQGCDQ